MEAGLDRIAAGALAREGMLEDFWRPFDAALGAAGGLTRKTVRAAIEARLDGFLFGPEGGDGEGPGRRRCPACGNGTLELKLSRYGPFVGCADWPGCGYRRSLAAAAADGGGYTGPRALGDDPDTGLAVTLRRGPTGWHLSPPWALPTDASAKPGPDCRADEGTCPLTQRRPAPIRVQASTPPTGTSKCFPGHEG